MTTIPDIHGHEILHLVHQTQPAFTRESLLAEAQRRWGPGARFCTCSTSGMSLEELIEFLLARGKLVEIDGQLQTIMSQVCSDGAPHEHHEQHH